MLSPEQQAAIGKYASLHANQTFSSAHGIANANQPAIERYTCVQWPMRKLRLRKLFSRHFGQLYENLHQRKFPAVRYGL